MDRLWVALIGVALLDGQGVANEHNHCRWKKRKEEIFLTHSAVSLPSSLFCSPSLPATGPSSK